MARKALKVILIPDTQVPPAHGVVSSDNYSGLPPDVGSDAGDTLLDSPTETLFAGRT